MKSKAKDAWSDVKKSMRNPKKESWMTKQKRNLAKVRPIRIKSK
jgi:hypothetical protein